MNQEVTRLLVPLRLDVSDLNDLRCLRAAEGFAELGMHDEADAEFAKVSPTSRVFRLLFVCGRLASAVG